MSEEILSNDSVKQETFSARLDRFEKINTWLPLRLSEDKIKEVMSWDDETFKAADKEKLKYYQHWINKYIIHLSDVYSMHFSRYTVLDKMINIEIAEDVNSLLNINKFLSYEERKNLAISRNEYVLEMYNKAIEHEMYFNRILKLIYSTSEMMKRLDNYVK